jgi:hypothetical protein
VHPPDIVLPKAYEPSITRAQSQQEGKQMTDEFSVKDSIGASLANATR